MKKKTLLLHLAMLGFSLLSARAQTAFTYQGKLTDDCCPATGLYDLQFKVLDAPTGGNQLSWTWGVPSVPVTNGLFMASLDFGTNVFTGPRRWLEIAVRTNNSQVTYVTLAPRTELTPTPYALCAQTANNVANAAIGTSQLAANSVTSAKISSGQVVKSLNGLTDAVNLQAGANITLTPNVGANTVTIAASGGGSSLWSQSGSSINYSAGNVGIGTAAPQANLHVSAPGGSGGQVRADGGFLAPWGPILAVPGGPKTRLMTMGWDGWGDRVDLEVPGANPNNALFSFNAISQERITETSSGNSLVLQAGSGSAMKVTGYNYSTGSAVPLYISVDGANTILNSRGGNVGIGTASPGYALDVVGRSRLRDGSAGLTAGLWLNTANSFGSGGAADIAFFGAMDPTRVGFFGNDPRGALGWGFTFDTVTGNVGIGTGTSYPTAKLRVQGEASVCALTITGGCDLSEPFKVSSVNASPGMALVIDEQNPGKLRLSDRAYDTRVAGILSGANGVHPGISMHQEGLIEGGQNVALSGRVYALADASDAPIHPGDLLTTSATPGHCMKATDPAKAQGAIIGKAMSALNKGRGMVLVLVSLQ